MQHRDRNRRLIRKRERNFLRSRAVLLALIVAFAAVSATRLAQANDNVSSNEETKPKTTGKKPASEASDPATQPGKRRDPFVVPTRVKREVKLETKKEPRPIGPPGIDGRLAEYRNLVRSASVTGQAVPSKLAPYLAEELTVTGIFRDSGGYGAFVLAGPTKLTFFARPGMRIYDGVIQEITPTGIKIARSIRYDDGSARPVQEFRALRSGK
jgi:hypothetical protein